MSLWRAAVFGAVVGTLAFVVVASTLRAFGIAP